MQCDHRCCFVVIVRLWSGPGNPTGSQLSRYGPHTHPRTLHSIGTVDRFHCLLVRGIGMPQGCRPTIATEMFSQRVCMETHTHQRISVHASALFRSSRFGCVDCQERTDPLATYGRTSNIATSFRGNTVRRTRIVVLAWLFRRHAITKPTCHASISLSL